MMRISDEIKLLKLNNTISKIMIKKLITSPVANSFPSLEKQRVVRVFRAVLIIKSCLWLFVSYNTITHLKFNDNDLSNII